MKALNKIAPYIHWLVRLSFAATFILHGSQKLMNLSDTAAFMHMPVFIVLLVALAELSGGILVVVGGFGVDWATRLGGLCVVPVMLGAIFMVHLPNGWDSQVGGMEFPALLLAIGISFFVRGNANMKIAV